MERDPSQPRRLVVLGSTGSIGTSTLDVVAHLNTAGPAFEVVGLAAGRNRDLLAEQAKRFGVADLALADASVDAIPSHWRVGPDAAASLVSDVARPGDVVLGAIVGAAGLDAILRAIDIGCDIALANKETLVAAGSLVMPLAKSKGVQLLPVDSEHSAIAQCMRAGRANEVRRIVLTASGGPFREWPAARIAEATVEEALNHPTWSMGPKITVDSASMMNKALEVIEAHWLFGLPADRIEVIVHPASIVHGFVEFVDGSVLAQLGPPDMRTPIQDALTWPAREPGCSRRLAWDELRRLEFEPADDERFPAVSLARAVIDRGGTAGAVFNAANEEAVEAFLAGAIPFGRIVSLVRHAIETVPVSELTDLADVHAADHAARAAVRGALGRAGAGAAAAASSGGGGARVRH